MMKGQATVTMINLRRIVLFFVVVWTFPCMEGHARTTDFRARAGVKVQKNITKKFTTSLEYEHRFDNYLTTFDKALLEPSVSYDLLKNLKVGAEWRFMVDQDLMRRIEYNQRVAMFVKVQHSFTDIDLNLRTALQYGFDELTFSAKNSQKLISRNTISIEYNWFGSKFKPFATYEFFYHINNPNGGIINQWRAKAGTSYRITRKSELSIYYLFESEINVAYPVDAHVVGIGYSYKL